MLKDKDKERYFKEARKFNKKIFASKDKMRKVWARQPMEVKIRELVLTCKSISYYVIPEVFNPRLKNSGTNLVYKPYPSPSPSIPDRIARGRIKAFGDDNYFILFNFAIKQ